MSDREIHLLYRRRPRSRLARWSGLALLAIMAWAWTSGELEPGELFDQRRLDNLERFLGELRPYPLQQRAEAGEPRGEDSALVTAGAWVVDLLASRGWSAAVLTLALSVAAIVLAALAALAIAPAATRTIARAEPYLPGPHPPGRGRRAAWWLLVTLTRGAMIFLRSIPEYVWAFVLIALLGPSPWPAVLALALHNAGILGKLTSEVSENFDPAPLAALRGLGASRSQILLLGIFPLVFPRFLLFFFYRWETCVREATVLGMLGIVSLGYWIVDARARNHYDEMFFLVLIGAALVLVGDLVSAAAREVVRRAA